MTRRYFATVAPPELVYNFGVPILQEFFELLQEQAGEAKPLESLARRWWFKNAECVEVEDQISVESRLSFERAFGLGPLAQLAAESELSAQRGVPLIHPLED